MHYLKSKPFLLRETFLYVSMHKAYTAFSDKDFQYVVKKLIFGQL